MKKPLSYTTWRFFIRKKFFNTIFYFVLRLLGEVFPFPSLPFHLPILLRPDFFLGLSLQGHRPLVKHTGSGRRRFWKGPHLLLWQVKQHSTECPLHEPYLKGGSELRQSFS